MLYDVRLLKINYYNTILKFLNNGEFILNSNVGHGLLLGDFLK